MRGATDIRVNIRNLAVGGAGVGEVIEQTDGAGDLLGITAFVPYSAMGELVSARVTERKGRYVHADLISVEEPSLKRVAPPCPYFGQCGGCELQHMLYSEQLRAKHAMIVGALRSGQLSTRVLDLVKPVVAGDPLGYRRRIKLHVDAQGKAGFYRTQTRAVVEVDACLIAELQVSASLKLLKELGGKLKGRVNSISIEGDDAGIVALLTAPYTMSDPAARDILKIAREYFPNVCLMAGGKEAGGVGRQILELPLDPGGMLRLRVPVGSFSQVNWKINMQLIQQLIAAAKPDQDSTVLDLFGGAGNFSLPLARAGANVTAVECDRRLVELGRESAGLHGLSKKLTFVHSSVEQYLKHNPIPAGAMIVADPPRSGLGPLVSQLEQGRTLALISCHLPSFVRDLKKLLDLGWQAETIEPFDMFAQTSYVEMLAILRRD